MWSDRSFSSYSSTHHRPLQQEPLQQEPLQQEPLHQGPLQPELARQVGQLVSCRRSCYHSCPPCWLVQKQRQAPQLQTMSKLQEVVLQLQQAPMQPEQQACRRVSLQQSHQTQRQASALPRLQLKQDAMMNPKQRLPFPASLQTRPLVQ